MMTEQSEPPLVPRPGPGSPAGWAAQREEVAHGRGQAPWEPSLSTSRTSSIGWGKPRRPDRVELDDPGPDPEQVRLRGDLHEAGLHEVLDELHPQAVVLLPVRPF